MDRLSMQEYRALAQAVIVHDDFTNVAYPSPGFWVTQLHQRGLMSCEKRWHKEAHAWMWFYTVTRAGRDAYLSYGKPYVPMTTAALEDA